jgi:hypothetical protein
MSAYLERRLEELNAEIRSYPGPIARCDLHLPALLAERGAIVENMNKERCPPEALWGHDGGRTND